MSDKTATERLRELLDKRGIRWGIADYSRRRLMTVWRVDGQEWQFFEDRKTGWTNLSCRMDYLTPEQAIAATLGAGTCEVDVLNTGDCAGYECSEYIMHCNGCGHEFGYVLYNEDGDVWMSEPPNHCPNCGAKVVEPTTNDVDAEVDE